MAVKKAAPEEILCGMNMIRPVLGNISESTVLRIKRDYPHFPIRKLRGQWVSCRKELERWWRDYVLGEFD